MLRTSPRESTWSPSQRRPPQEKLTKLQNEGDWTALLVLSEEQKTLPFGEIWAQYCRECDVPADGVWLSLVKKYEYQVLRKRG